ALVILDALPLTANGKVDRRALPAPEGRPEVGAYVAPRNATEEALAAIWCEVLRLDRVGIEDNFFELGGHSLVAARVVARVRDVFEVELALRALFDAPTVRGLAERIEEARQSHVLRTEELKAKIAEMSDEEVLALLNQLRQTGH